MFNEFAALLFGARDFGHRAHLRTDTHAKHVILESFYTDMTDLADTLVECYQGINGVVDLPYVDLPIAGPDPLPFIEELAEVFKGTRDEAVADNRPLNNIADEIEQLFDSTIYKLRELK
jgi:hypothetical protein